MLVNSTGRIAVNVTFKFMLFLKVLTVSRQSDSSHKDH